MSHESLDALEEKVREVSHRLAGMRDENASLRARVEELERELEAQRGAGGTGPDWDRDEVRRRVEGLTARLAELLEL